MNKFDESFFCSFCHERYEFCGCPADEFDDSWISPAVCGECGGECNGLFYFAGDATGRCSYCHNNKRGMTWNSLPDWF